MASRKSRKPARRDRAKSPESRGEHHELDKYRRQVIKEAAERAAKASEEAEKAARRASEAAERAVKAAKEADEARDDACDAAAVAGEAEDIVSRVGETVKKGEPDSEDAAANAMHQAEVAVQQSVAAAERAAERAMASASSSSSSWRKPGQAGSRTDRG